MERMINVIAKIEKANRPKYFIRNGICVRIDNIAFVQKEKSMPYGMGSENVAACSVAIGIFGAGSQFPVILIPCESEAEQSVIFTELTTILAAL